MSPSTQDFAHRVAIILAGILIAGAFAYIAVVNAIQGDGHALALAAQLQPYVMTGFASLAGILGINSLTSAYVAVKTAQANPASVPAAPAPALVTAPADAPSDAAPAV